MADKKITELTELSILSDSDLLAGVDLYNNVTSKIAVQTLKEYMGGTYTAGTNIVIDNNVISAPNVYTKAETENLILSAFGDIGSILDEINGETI